MLRTRHTCFFSQLVALIIYTLLYPSMNHSVRPLNRSVHTLAHYIAQQTHDIINNRGQTRTSMCLGNTSTSRIVSLYALIIHEVFLGIFRHTPEHTVQWATMIREKIRKNPNDSPCSRINSANHCCPLYMQCVRNTHMFDCIFLRSVFERSDIYIYSK